MAKPNKPVVPPAPQRSNPDTFSDRAEASLVFWPTFADYLSDVATFVDETATSDGSFTTAQATSIQENSGKRTYPEGDEEKLGTIERNAKDDQTETDIIDLIEGASDDNRLDAERLRNLPTNTNDYVDSLDVTGTTLTLGRTGSLADLTAELPASTDGGTGLTTAQTVKLRDIEQRAEVNIKTNWLETNIDDDSYLQNKPTDEITANTRKRSYPVGDRDKLGRIDDNAQVNVKPDFNASESATDGILNKPTIPGTATTSRSGHIAIATLAQARTGQLSNRAVAPSGVKAVVDVEKTARESEDSALGQRITDAAATAATQHQTLQTNIDNATAPTAPSSGLTQTQVDTRISGKVENFAETGFPSSTIPESRFGDRTISANRLKDGVLPTGITLAEQRAIIENVGKRSYPTSDRDKLERIADRAEVNVQGDFNQTNTGSDSYLRNKPTKATMAKAGLIETTNQTEARLGEDNERAMTALRVKDVVDIATPSASEGRRGLSWFATESEIDSGASGGKVVLASRLKRKTDQEIAAREAADTALGVRITNDAAAAATQHQTLQTNIDNATSPTAPSSGLTQGQVDNRISSKVENFAETGFPNIKIPSARFEIGSIAGEKLESLAVTNDKIANRAITEVKILNAAIISTKLRDLAVTTAKIARGAVTADKIASGVIPTNTNDYVDSLDVTGTTLTLGRTGSLADLTAELPASGGAGLTTEQAQDLEVNKAKRSYPQADQIKLRDIEEDAKDDQTASEINTLLEAVETEADKLDASAIKNLPAAGTGGIAASAVEDFAKTDNDASVPRAKTLPATLEVKTFSGQYDDGETFNATNNSKPKGITVVGDNILIATQNDPNKLFAHNKDTHIRVPSADWNSMFGTDTTGITRNETHLYAADYEFGMIHAFLISDKSHVPALDITCVAANNRPIGVWIDNGNIIVSQDNSRLVFTYDLETKLQNTTDPYTFALHAANTRVDAMWSDSEHIWFADSGTDYVYAYLLSTGAHNSALSFDLNSGNGDTTGMWGVDNQFLISNRSTARIFVYKQFDITEAEAGSVKVATPAQIDTGESDITVVSAKELDRKLDEKQDTLTEGDNVTISDSGVISVSVSDSGGRDTAAELLVKLQTVDANTDGINASTLQSLQATDFVRAHVLVTDFNNIVGFTNASISGYYLGSTTNAPTTEDGVFFQLSANDASGASTRDIVQIVFPTGGTHWIRSKENAGASWPTTWTNASGLTETEVNALITAVTGRLNTNINAEVNARENADTALGVRITSNAADNAAMHQTLQTNIDNATSPTAPTSGLTQGQVDTRISSKVENYAEVDFPNIKIPSSRFGSESIAAGILADDSVDTANLAANSVTSAKIAGGAVRAFELATGAVTNSKYANNSISSEKMSSNSVGQANLQVGAVVESKIRNGAVTRLKIPVGTISSGHLRPNSVTEDKIASSAVITDKLARRAVTSDKLAELSVTIGKIEFNSISSVKIIPGAVVNAKIGPSAVTSTKIARAAVGTDKLALNAVTTPKIANSAVTNDKIADGTIEKAKLAFMIDAATGGGLSESEVNALIAASSGIGGGAADVSDELEALSNSVTLGSIHTSTKMTVGAVSSSRIGFLNKRTGSLRTLYSTAGSLSLDNDILVALVDYTIHSSHTHTLEVSGSKLSLTGGLVISGVEHNLTLVQNDENNSYFVIGLEVHQYTFTISTPLVSGTKYTLALKKEDGTYYKWGTRDVTFSDNVKLTGGSSSGGATASTSWMKRSSTSTQTLTTGFVNVPFATLRTDETADDITYADGKFTAVEAGSYKLGGFVTIQDMTGTRAQLELQIFVDGVAHAHSHTSGYIRNQDLVNSVHQWTIAIPNEPFLLTAGQTIEIRVKNPTTLTGTSIKGVDSEIWFERLSGGGGGEITTTDVSNLDTINKSGFYYFAGGAIGSPSEDEDGTVAVIYGDSLHVSQRAVVGINKVYVRVKRNATDYSSWKRVDNETSSGPDFTSEEKVMPFNFQSVIVSHELGVNPSQVWGYLVCKSANGGYDVGERVHLSTNVQSATTGHSIFSNTTKIEFKVMSDNTSIPNQVGSTINFNIANIRSGWRLVLLANK